MMINPLVIRAYVWSRQRIEILNRRDGEEVIGEPEGKSICNADGVGF